MSRALLILLVPALLAVAVLALARLGVFSGQVPADLGVRDGRFKPPSRTPNSVSSQADLYPEHPMRDDARIAALPAAAGGAALTALRKVIDGRDDARVVEERTDYLRVEFTSRWLRFVDDAEFWYDPATQAIQLRSASRLGRKDFGVNRARVEALRRALSGPT